MAGVREIVHDEQPTRTPSQPKMAGVFDRLVEAILEQTAAVNDLVKEVRDLVQAVKEERKP